MLQGLGIDAAPTSIGLDEALASEVVGGPRERRVRGVRALFPRIETTSQKPSRRSKEVPGVSGARPDQITIEEFRRLDLRVGEVVEAEAVPDSRKLVRLRVRLKDEERTIVASLREHYPPETWAGRQVILAANLQPITLMGIQSQGMVLAAEDDAGRIVLLKPDQPIPPGSKIR